MPSNLLQMVKINEQLNEADTDTERFEENVYICGRKRECDVPFFYFDMLKEIEKYLDELLLQDDDFADCFLVELKNEGNSLWVFMDADSGINLKQCAVISRKLESFIEEKGLLPEKYKIEVSSPGLANPLRLRRQYDKNKGRKLKVKLAESGKLEGKLQEVNDLGIKLIVTKNKKETEEVSLAWDQVRESYVMVSF